MLETFPPASARAAANHGVGGGLLGPQGAAAEAPGAAGAELEGPGGPAAAAVAGVVNVVAPPLHMVEEVLKQQLRRCGRSVGEVWEEGVGKCVGGVCTFGSRTQPAVRPCAPVGVVLFVL